MELVAMHKPAVVPAPLPPPPAWHKLTAAPPACLQRAQAWPLDTSSLQVVNFFPSGAEYVFGSIMIAIELHGNAAHTKAWASAARGGSTGPTAA